jgi:hypothetical protein
MRVARAISAPLIPVAMSAANLEDVEMLFMEANIRQRIYQCKPVDASSG